MQYKIGRVTHFYSKIGVAVIELDAELAVGERIKFVRGGEDLFEQDVLSIQQEHEKVASAGKRSVIGLKSLKPVKEGAEVYKLTPR